MKFSNITAGYFAFKTLEPMSLSASILQKLRACSLKTYSGPFPQRIPRLSYFQELLLNEDEAGRSLMSQEVEKIRKSILEDPSCLNFLKFGMRYGLGSNVIDAINKILPSSNKRLRIELILQRDFAETQVYYPNLKSDSNAALIEIIHSDYNIYDLDLLAQVAARIIVKNVRYFRFSVDHRTLKLCDAILTNFLKNSADNFSEIYRSAVLRRGYPMLPGMPLVTVKHHVASAVQLVQSLVPSNILESELKKELLFTTYLTESKTLRRGDDPEGAVASLDRMIELDPHESTGYGELGLYMYQLGRFSDSIRNLEKAVRLGPPNLSMNSYYLGLSYDITGAHEQMIESMLNSIAFDSGALSPYLHLIKFYNNDGNSAMSSKLISKVLGDEDLAGQLTEEEKLQLLKSRGA